MRRDEMRRDVRRCIARMALYCAFQVGHPLLVCVRCGDRRGKGGVYSEPDRFSVWYEDVVISTASQKISDCDLATRYSSANVRILPFTWQECNTCCDTIFSVHRPLFMRRADLSGDNSTTYNVTGDTTTCSDLLLTFGLTSNQFIAQNPVS